MMENAHSLLVSDLAKPGDLIASALTPDMADLWHAATGISGEAGELLDAIKKHVVYNKPLDFDNVIEELGDLRFYMEQLRQRVSVLTGQDISWEEILRYNINKLNRRYAAGYTDQAAQQRADKEPGQ